jgi:hypothetical protein
MKLCIYLNTYNLLLSIEKENISTDGYLLISKRDPQIPIELKTDCLYFNPLLKKGENHVYSWADDQFTSIYTGKPLKAKPNERGWFMLPPRNLGPTDIHPNVKRLITRSPKLTGVIAQVSRTTMNLRIPVDLELSSPDVWIAWICAQKQVLTPSLKTAFGTIHAGTVGIAFSEELRTYLETGREPEPTVEIKIRWLELRKIKSIKRRLYESTEWQLKINPKLLDNQSDLLTYAGEQLGSGWDQLEEYVTGEDTIEQPVEEPCVKVPLIFIKDGPSWKLFNSDIDRPTSIIELFNEAITAATPNTP